uniref:DNA replication complex GINS protein PSF3 n=1 Tax=Photinus pyralis TaxID=7054 RepID=A0A1Y1JX65_PHOPY
MSLCYSYTPNYFSIEDILVTQERIPSKFLVNVPKLGKLNPSAEENDIKQGTALDLPFWLADPLSFARHPLISIELPRVYKEAYREILKADATAVDLHKLGLYFYELGLYVKRLDPRREVEAILLHTFRSRFKELMDFADDVVCDPVKQNRLDMLERTLFQKAHFSRMQLKSWLNNSEMRLEAATMVINHKKRKRIDVDDLF